MTREEAITLMDELQVCIKEHPIIAEWLVEIADRKTEPSNSEKPNGSDEPQTDNGIGCSRCEGRFDCYDRDMPHAVRCNNYGKITDEPQTERSSE